MATFLNLIYFCAFVYICKQKICDFECKLSNVDVISRLLHEKYNENELTSLMFFEMPGKTDYKHSIYSFEITMQERFFLQFLLKFKYMENAFISSICGFCGAVRKRFPLILWVFRHTHFSKSFRNYNLP